MFLIFIQDMGDDISKEEAVFLKYVDDSKCMRSIEEEEQLEQFQGTLNKIYHWQEVNNTTFNAAKFQLVRYGPKTETKNNTTLFSNGMLEAQTPEEEVKDLGVIVDDGATFAPQRKNAVLKAKQKTGWVLKTFEARDQTTMV